MKIELNEYEISEISDALRKYARYLTDELGFEYENKIKEEMDISFVHARLHRLTAITNIIEKFIKLEKEQNGKN